MVVAWSPLRHEAHGRTRAAKQLIPGLVPHEKRPWEPIASIEGDQSQRYGSHTSRARLDLVP